MLKIRLRRTGKRNQPHYRVVVAEHTAPVTGKIVASLGHFDPRTKQLVVDKEEALRWMAQGAQPSNTVARLLLKHGLAHKALVVHKFVERPSKKTPVEVPEKPSEAPAEATESTETSAEEVVAETVAEESPAEESNSADATEDKTTESNSADASLDKPAEALADSTTGETPVSEEPATEPETPKEETAEPVTETNDSIEEKSE